MRRCGLPISNKTKSLSERPVRRFANWWETTAVEKFLEDIEFLLQKSAFLTILGILSNLAILVAVVAFVFGEEIRRNNEVFSAWQTITSAEGQSGSGGRIEALKFLYSRPLRFPWIGWTYDQVWDKQVQKCEWKTLWGLRWKRQDLVGLSSPQAYIRNIDLCGANLNSVNLSQADLLFANLSSTKLSKANLNRANLNRVNLSEANLSGANLRVADFLFANLSGANLSKADFREDLHFGKVKNLTPKQVKSSCYWEEAFFDSEFEAKLKKEPDQEVDCSIWEK